jgi:hypothetical protein
MKQRNLAQLENRLLGALRESFLRQEACVPSESWRRQVMLRLHVEAPPDHIAITNAETWAWRIACMAAALAIIAGIALSLLRPAEADLTWDISLSKTSCEWMLALSE